MKRPTAPLVLILGGTAEAAAMAAMLADRGIDVMTSLAGRTREPAPLKGTVRTGGFGGADGLAAFIRENGVSLLVDMTHPFARRISENARRASAETGVPLLAWQRPGWAREEGDLWTEVPDIAAALTAIPPHARVLLALGSQHIAPFAARADVHFLVRMVDPPQTPLPLPDHELLLAKPGAVEDEFALLRTRRITHIVCRNSGGAASYAKVAAARLLGLPVIMIGQSDAESGVTSFEDFQAAVLAALS